MKCVIRLTFIISCNYSLDCVKMNGKNMNISKIFNLQFHNQDRLWLSENLSRNYDLICRLVYLYIHSIPSDTLLRANFKRRNNFYTLCFLFMIHCISIYYITSLIQGYISHIFNIYIVM